MYQISDNFIMYLISLRSTIIPLYILNVQNVQEQFIP